MSSAQLNSTKRARDSQSKHKAEQEAAEQRRDLNTGAHGHVSLRQRLVVEQEGDDEREEREARAAQLETDSPVPREEDHCGREHVERDLDQDLRRDERRPAVHPARTLADLVDVAHVDERHLRLVGKRYRQNGRHEDRLEEAMPITDARI